MSAFNSMERVGKRLEGLKNKKRFKCSRDLKCKFSFRIAP